MSQRIRCNECHALIGIGDRHALYCSELPDNRRGTKAMSKPEGTMTQYSENLFQLACNLNREYRRTLLADRPPIVTREGEASMKPAYCPTCESTNIEHARKGHPIPWDCLDCGARFSAADFNDPPPTRREALEELYSLCCQWHEGGEDRFPPGIKKQLDVVRTARP